MIRNLLILVALAAVVGLPFLLRPRDSLLAHADETLVIITPHNEAIRYEFARGFRDWYKAKTGRLVRIDWRVPGGTTEIARYLASEYQAPFETLWRRRQKMHWDAATQRAFDDPKIKLGPDPAKDTEPQMARRAFLNSDVGIGIDLFFGGGSFDFAQQAAAGRLVDSGLLRAHPEWFGGGPEQIPPTLGGEPYWDKNGLWFGTVLSAFGVCYNFDGMRQIIDQPADGGSPVPDPTNLRGRGGRPEGWEDLANPLCFGRVALADPNKSGSVARAFEMIVQQQIQQARPRVEGFFGPRRPAAAVSPTDFTDTPIFEPEEMERQKIRQLHDGWEKGMRLIQMAGANARYFTDSAPNVAIDVADGDAALGMAIDFYGRFEAESSRDARTGQERMRYFNPPGGTSVGVDPIGLLRGAPHRELALAFEEYVLSLDGQKLWNFKVGTPGGPRKYALRRLPIRRELYAPEYAAYRSDPDVFPYEEAKNFTYHPEWTGALFNPLRFVVRVMCVDPHDEARAALAALIKAGFPPEATRVFADVSAVSYEDTKAHINEVLRSGDKLAETRMAAQYTARFRAQYQRAADLARAGR